MALRPLILIFLCGGLVSCATAKRPASGPLTEDRLARGYLVVRALDESAPVVEIQLRNTLAGFKVLSFKEAVADSIPTQVCAGRGRLKGAIAFLEIQCPSDSHNFEIDFQGAGPAELEQGAEVRVRSPATRDQWVPLVAERRDRPFFRSP